MFWNKQNVSTSEMFEKKPHLWHVIGTIVGVVFVLLSMGVSGVLPMQLAEKVFARQTTLTNFCPDPQVG